MPGCSCQRTCVLCWAPLVLKRMAGQVSVGGAPCGLSGDQVAHHGVQRGVGLVLSYTELVGRGQEGVPPTPSANIVTCPTSKSSSRGYRRWSAASSSDIPPRYVPGAWFRYGAASMEREVADPSLVSRTASPMDRGRPDWLDVRLSIQYPWRAA